MLSPNSSSVAAFLRGPVLLLLCAMALILSGCTSSGSGSDTSSYVGPSITSAKTKQADARKAVTKAKKAVKKAENDLKSLERKIARAERRLKRRKLSQSKREAIEKTIKADKRKVRSAKRAISRSERTLARAERSEKRATRRVARANDEAKRSERRLAERKKRRQQEEAQQEIARDEPKKRRSRLFARNEPALENVKDYGARIDNAFPIAAVPVEKLDKRLFRQEVKYKTSQRPGTIVVDTRARFLYLVQPGGRAMRYGIGVGKAGFSWSGSAHIGWKQEWPKWTPPEEMIQRRPELAKWGVDNGGMPGGPSNPLGARALYLMKDGKDTLYRLHGTPEWQSIGTAASSGCIRLINQDVIDLYKRVPNGTKVVVL